MEPKRVYITEKAREVVDQLRESNGELIFHQSGGCCDGSSPMCFPADELMLDDNDVHLGEIHGCKFYMTKDQFEYWKHTILTIDVTEGRGSSFSLEIPLGLRFVVKSRLMDENESRQFAPGQNA
jgi:uncharacterized protein (DUF779 family)